MQQKSAPGPFDLGFAPLRSLRLAKEVSQGRLAETAGIGRERVLLMEKGQRTKDVTLYELIHYSRALGVPLHHLFRVVDE